MDRILQANINRSRRAQDLLVHTMRERRVGLAVLSEPYVVPSHSLWFGDAYGSVCIVVNGGDGSPPCTLVESGGGFVVVKWGTLIVAGCYASPNIGLASFEEFLGELGVCLRGLLARPALVLGDFNSKSTLWGNPRTDARGGALEIWAAGLELRLLNRGSVSTCVRWNGTSIVDVSWASPAAARRVVGWRVAEELESLSDHLHIIVEVSSAAIRPETRRAGTRGPRWALKRLDRDILRAAALAVAWSDHPTEPCGADAGADWFRGKMVELCDSAMPRARSSPRRSAYWWSEGIAELRRSCVLARRRYTRSRRRRRGGDEAARAALYVAYRQATVALQRAIARAKAEAWSELLQTLDGDPWGRPYKIVLQKLRHGDAPLTEGMDPQLLGRVVDTLFPRHDGGEGQPAPADPNTWSAELRVTEGELARAIRRLGAKNTAPGPDGVPGKALVLALDVLGPRLGQIFDQCLGLGTFPTGWKTSRLVLLRKEGRPADSPSAYRPICLLDEAGKLFERIIAARLVRHLSAVGPDLSDSQFGFREGRSTVDAVKRVRSLSEAAVARGGVALAVSIDIVNAFGTLPWEGIRGALEYHRVPPYLQAVVRDFLRNRWVEYTDASGRTQRREIQCGVPQGSVLGPLLWDLAFDAVLRAAVPPGTSVVCYADDTLIVAGGDTWRRTTRLAEVAVACVVGRIQELGLRIAPGKTEAMWFHALPPSREPPQSWIRVGGDYVEVGRGFKYLGLHLDSRWRFEDHFDRVAPRTERAAAALGRLLPNIGGPEVRVRRLYAGVVQSIMLYGAPVWSGDLMASKKSLTLLLRVQRLLAIRIVRGYRTISAEAAMLLAGLIPVDLLAAELAAVYNCRAGLREAGLDPPGDAVGAERRRARTASLAAWALRIGSAPRNAGRRVSEALLPVLKSWIGRSWGVPTYRMTQVLAGHGCFGEYLCRVGKEPTAQCHHCGAAQDTAQHTLEECPAWGTERRVLRQTVGWDLSLPALVREMIRGERSWKAVSSFCEQVMSQKEEAERVRERDPASARSVMRAGRGFRRPRPPPPRPRRT